MKNWVTVNASINMYTFESIGQTTSLATKWLWRYNNEQSISLDGSGSFRWSLDDVAQSLGKTPINNRRLWI